MTVWRPFSERLMRFQGWSVLRIELISLLKIEFTFMFLPMVVPMYLRLEFRGVCGKMDCH